MSERVVERAWADLRMFLGQLVVPYLFVVLESALGRTVRVGEHSVDMGVVFECVG